MPLSDYGIDPGADFEAYYPDLETVTVLSINAITGATLATATNVKAAKLIRKRETGSARSGEVWTHRDEFWLRVDALGFTLKPGDRITQAGGTVWLVDEVNEVAGELARCPVTRKR